MKKILICVWWWATVSLLPAQDVLDFESAPVQYSQRKADNILEGVIQRAEKGEKTLAYQEEQGYLRALLGELGISPSSQVLVFAKSSLQGHYIGPKTPRAIYFNDDSFVGFVQGEGGLLEIITTDSNIGVAFYTLTQDPEEKPIPHRETNRCMSCHGGTRSKGVPGVMVRSLVTDPEGKHVVAAGNYRTDHSSPISQRWGGWYVTGTSGDQKHLGNFRLASNKKPKVIDNAKGQNVTSLSPLVDTRPYLQPHSDMVALMVLEHQSDVVNHMTRLRFVGEMFGKTDPKKVDEAVDDLVRQICFQGETRLTSPIQGTSQFQREFELKGPKDSKGRSLRQFDLKSRMFRYPLSYMVYSRAFAALPGELRNKVLEHLYQVLNDTSPKGIYAHLNVAERSELVEIVRETVPNLPDSWKGSSQARK